MSIDSKFSWDAMKDFSPVEGRLRQHLFKVYSTMTATLAMAAVGAWAHVLYNLGGLITLIATCGLIFALFGTPATKKNVAKRTLFLFGIGFFQGCSIGPLIGYSLAVDSGDILATAFTGTFIIFACFSGSALLARKRSLLYLGAILSSALSLVFWLGLINIFLRSEMLYAVQLYGGLLLFCGFVMFDTQMVIHKFHSGDNDFIAHSLQLFLDFVNIFVRLVAILLKNKDTKKSRR